MTSSPLDDAIAYAQAHEVPWPRDPDAAPARAGGLGRPPRRPAALQPPARAGACARPQSGVVLAARQGDRRLGRAGARRPDLQRRQDLPRAARRRRAGRRACCPTRTSRWRRGCPASASTTRAQPRRHLGASADADQRMGGHVLRPARQGRPLAQGGARPAARRPGPRATRGRCSRRARTGNTTTCASTSSRWRCCTCSAGRCPRSSSSACCGRSAAARASPGAATTMPGSSCPASVACSRCPAARTGARGVSISARDQARIGQLLLDGGAAAGRQLVPARLDREDDGALRRSRRSTAGCSG